MKRIISMLLICAATLTVLSSCESSGIPTDTTTATNTSEETVTTVAPPLTTATDVTVTPTSEETTTLEETEEFSGRSYVIEKPIDDDTDLKEIFRDFCTQYRDLFIAHREKGGPRVELEFEFFGKILNVETDLNGEVDIPHYPYGIDHDNIPEGLEKYSRVYFSAPNSTDGYKSLRRLDLFTFEMFENMVRDEEVTKVVISLVQTTLGY